jgi:phospholipid N-methyltransferase
MLGGCSAGMLDDGAAVPKRIVLPNLFRIENVIKGMKYVINTNQLLSFQDPVLDVMHVCLPLTSFSSAIFLLIVANSTYEVSMASVGTLFIPKFMKPGQLL